MLKAILGGIIITFVGVLFAANFSILPGGEYADQFIASLLIYTLLVISVLGLQILSRRSSKGNDDPSDDNKDS